MFSPIRVRASKILLPLLLMIVAAVPVAAADDSGPPAATGEDAHAEHAAEALPAAVLPDHPNVHHQPVNSIHLFLGETWERVEGADLTEKGFTFGIEYFRALSDRWAAGIALERAAGDIRGTLLFALAEFNVVGDLWFVTGPGVEFRDAYKEGRHGGSERRGQFTVDRAAHDLETLLRERDRTVFVFRLGVGYAIHVGERVVLIPTVDLDFVGRDEALVLGGILAYHF